jgi:hypothetical protein
MSNKELSLEEIVEIKKNIVQSIMEDLNLPELTGREYGHIESEIDKSVNSGLYDLLRRIEEQRKRDREEFIADFKRTFIDREIVDIDKGISYNTAVYLEEKIKVKQIERFLDKYLNSNKD